MKQSLMWSNPHTIAQLANALNKGALVLGSSDTVVGLLAPATQQGFDALNAIKGRPADKPYLLLAHSQERVTALAAHIPDYAAILMQACWPGPLTLIFKAADDVPAYMKSKEQSIAIRIPQHAGLLQLLSIIPLLFSTSANKAGKPVPATMDQIDQELLAHINVIVTDSENQKISTIPSTIIDCTGPTPQLVREGMYSHQQLETLIGPIAGLSKHY